MVDLKLVDYIKNAKKKGYDKKELKQILKENEWSSSEISDAFNFIENKNQQISKPTEASNKNKILIDFIKKSLEEGISEDQIKQALTAKHWPIEKINNSFAVVNQHKLKKKKEVKIKVKPKQEKELPKERKKFNFKKVGLYFMWFIIISIILSLSITMFFYIQAMVSYEVVNPNTGILQNGICLNEDCSDMKNYIYDQINPQLWIILIMGLSISLLILTIHALIPKKELIIWTSNILFFLYMIYLFYLWFIGTRV